MVGRKGAEVREGVAMDPTKFGRKLTPMALRHQTRHRIELMCVLCDVFVLRIIFLKFSLRAQEVTSQKIARWSTPTHGQRAVLESAIRPILVTVSDQMAFPIT